MHINDGQQRQVTHAYMCGRMDVLRHIFLNFMDPCYRNNLESLRITLCIYKIPG
jgi:hypothetical protein